MHVACHSCRADMLFAELSDSHHFTNLVPTARSEPKKTVFCAVMPGHRFPSSLLIVL